MSRRMKNLPLIKIFRADNAKLIYNQYNSPVSEVITGGTHSSLIETLMNRSRHVNNLTTVSNHGLLRAFILRAVYTSLDQATNFRLCQFLE